MKHKIIPILTFILGAIIFGSIGVYAASEIFANQIRYKDTTVDAALNDLYNFTNSFGKDMVLEEVSRKTAYSGLNTQITIPASDAYKYYYVTGSYSGGACSSATNCNNIINFSFTNANSVKLGSSYRYSGTQVAGGGYLVFPVDKSSDIVVTLNSGLDAVAIYGIK